MLASGIHNAELIFLLLLVFVVSLAALAKRLKVPYPIVLVIGGLLLTFIPHIPRVALNPDVVFLVVLPPLLFSSAYATSWRDFEFNLVSIILLAFGLVAFTVFGAAAASRWILPGFDWRTGLVLGAVVSPTDAIAATSIAQRLCLPKRITTILEGESLINDVSGLMALQFATAVLVTGYAPSLFEGTAKFLYLVFGSIAIGLAIAKLIHVVLSKIDHAEIEITISLIAPYFAYLTAESAHASGVMATVACGLYLGNKSSLFFSSGARLTGSAVWNTLTFVLNGFVFILIGFQLPYVLSGIQTMSLGRVLLAGALLSATLILLRLIWVFPGARVAQAIRKHLLHQDVTLPSGKSLFIVGWTGMRGVLSLAAAISLPEVLSNGSPFPHRNEMIFLTFCVIFVTLVLQGLTLPPLIRRLGLSGQGGKNVEEAQARSAMVDAALAYLEQARDADRPEFIPVYDDLIRYERHRRNVFDASDSAETGFRREDYERFRELSQNVRALQRATILNLRNHNEIDDEVMRKLEHELDLIEARYAVAEHA
jgi:CPA1 family monovalent cation:H+ antiporter